MKKGLWILVWVLIGFYGFGQDSQWSIKFADNIIKRFPRTINDMTGKGWEYSNSIVLHGIEKVYNATGEEKYLNYIKKYVDSYVNSTGRISDFEAESNNLDKLHPGVLCLFLYENTGMEKYKIAAEKVRAEFDNQPRNLSGGFWHKQRYPNQMWLDGIYMAEPFLVKYGVMFGDEEYCFNEATKQVLLLAEHAIDTTTNLLRHGWDETKSASWANATTGVSPEVWSRAMGWYTMALFDIIKYLPKEHENYDAMIALLNKVAEGLKASQDSDTGLWSQVMDKGGQSRNFHELSGSGMFVYALKSSIDSGYIDQSYLSVVEKAWEGMQNYISESGSTLVFKGYVGGMGILDSYNSYVGKSQETCPPSRHPHGYCAVLMASAAMELDKPLPRFSFELSPVENGSVTANPEPGEYLSGKKIRLTAKADEGYEFEYWNNDPKMTSRIVDVYLDSTAVYTATFNKIVDPVGISTFAGPKVQVNPNPVKSTFKIEYSSRPSKVQLLDLKGRALEIKSLQIDGKQLYGDISNLASGMYFLKLTYAEEKTTVKVMKE